MEIPIVAVSYVTV